MSSVVVAQARRLIDSSPAAQNDTDCLLTRIRPNLQPPSGGRRSRRRYRRPGPLPAPPQSLLQARGGRRHGERQERGGLAPAPRSHEQDRGGHGALCDDLWRQRRPAPAAGLPRRSVRQTWAQQPGRARVGARDRPASIVSDIRGLVTVVLQRPESDLRNNVERIVRRSDLPEASQAAIRPLHAGQSRGVGGRAILRRVMHADGEFVHHVRAQYLRVVHLAVITRASGLNEI